MTMQSRLVTSASVRVLPTVAVRMVDGVTDLGGTPAAPPVLIRGLGRPGRGAKRRNNLAGEDVPAGSC
jgi:hypothetical protein